MRWTRTLLGAAVALLALVAPAGAATLCPGCGSPFAALTVPPVVTITNAPPTLTNNVHLEFAFEADVDGVTFECRDYIPGNEPGDWIECTSPHTVRDLVDGPHVFEVRGRIGAEEGEPAVHAFTVDTVPPAPPQIAEPPDGTVRRVTGPLALTGVTDPTTAVEVRADGQPLGDADVDPQGGWSFTTPELAPGTRVFTAVARDAAGNVSDPSAPVTVYVHPAGPMAAIAGPTLTNDDTPTFTLSANEPNVTFRCTLGSTAVPCGPTVTPGPLGDGDYSLAVRAVGADDVEGAPVTHAFTVDRTPPPAPQVSGGAAGNAASFAIAPTPEGVAVECRLEGPGRSEPFAPCAGRLDYAGLAPGSYRFVVRASDLAGNVSQTVRTFTIAVAQPQVLPPPAVPPAPTATPAPRPEFRRSAVARTVRGRVLVRRPGADAFAELNGSQSIPMGSTVDARQGRVRITAEPRPGRPARRAEFRGGVFRLTQTRTLVDLRLVEPLACPARRGGNATRRLWGAGKGAFRITGAHSAATARGATWLVQDTCATTLTRVTQGVVAVRDARLKKTILVRKGKRHVARSRR